MIFSQTSTEKLRSLAKRQLETLELWIRRIIDEEFSSHYGDDYFNYKFKDGNSLISKKISTDAIKWSTQDPIRYPRTIDAILLENAISIVCNQNNRAIFTKYFEAYYGDNQHVKNTLEELIPIRNKLSHANPITIRDAEKVFCYSNDIIDSFKSYYERVNLSKMYNIPTFIKYSDSLGNQTVINENRKILDIRNNIIYANDRLIIEVEVDSTYDKNSYDITWWFKKIETTEHSLSNNKTKITIQLTESNIDANFEIQIKIITNRDWHKHVDYDDFIWTNNYSVVPIIP